jgi:hypothetical protein
VTSLQSIAGRVEAFGNSTLRRLELVIQRRGDGTYFNGTSFGATSVRLPVNTTGEVWRYDNARLSGAELLPGTYTLAIVAYDQTGRRFTSIINVTVVRPTQST